MVPLDGSSAAEIALPWAVYLAGLFHAEILLFHAIEKNAPNQIHGQTHLAHESEALSYLSNIARSLVAHQNILYGITSHVHVEETTNVAESIALHMKELEPDLIIMCSHGKSNFTQAFIGSLATRVIGLGDIPVFLIKSETSNEKTVVSFSHVIVPLDNASIHDKAIQYGAAFSRAANARLSLLSVVPSLHSLKSKEGGWGLMSPTASAALLDIEEASMREHLDEHRKMLLENGHQASIQVVRGDAARMIARKARKEPLSLIVLGTHGRSGMEAFWKGSVAAKVVSLANAPIVLVPLRE